MNCPVCKRELAPTLSICLTCGAMMNDTVREELASKIVRPPNTEIPKAEIPKFEPIVPWTPQPIKRPTPVEAGPVAQPKRTPAPVALPPVPEPTKPKVVTAKLRKDTSPTLVDFQHANPTLPDWRLQLQNTIRKRNIPQRFDGASAPAAAVAVSEPTDLQKPEPIMAAASVIQNEKLANAMKRIEASKKTFGSGAAVGMAVAAQARAKKASLPDRPRPFDIVERTAETETPMPRPAIPITDIPKPKLVPAFRLEKKKFDTNKLPPIPEPETPLPVETITNEETSEAATEVRTKISFDRLRIWNTDESKETAETEIRTEDEIDDLAPLSMRFGAAVFDLIIGGFASGIVLSPLLVSSTLALTSGGLFAAFGGAIFVMFLYFTGSIALMGRTFGMKLFSIEIIDAEANELPTFHQAAVHSAVYLLSLMLFGLGFLPALFNEERRTMHDLVSGTLLIREY